MDRASVEAVRKRYAEALNDLREADDFDEITEVTHPNITVNVNNSKPDSEPPLPAKWIKPFKIGLMIAGVVIGIATTIWRLVHR